MTVWLWILTAIALPTGLSVMLLRRWMGWPVGPGALALHCGAGFLLAVVVSGDLLWLLGNRPLATLGQIGWSVLLAAALLLAVGEWRRGSPGGAARRWEGVRGSLAFARGLPVLLLLVVFALLLSQALTLPTLTWDAWNAWLAKPKAWFHAGATLPFRDLVPWLQTPAGESLSIVAASYPEALPRFVLWVAAAADTWRDAYVQVLWPLLWLALGGILFGLLRMLGLRRGLAWGALGFLLTLPMVLAHASLAGYADLWLASTVLLSCGLIALHMARRVPGTRSLAALCLLLLPTLKMEGAIYALLIAAAWAVCSLPPRWRAATLIVLPGVSLALFVSVGLHFPVPGVGWFTFRWGQASGPFLGDMQLYWRPVAGTVAESMWLLPNWSLLWYLVVPVTLWRWRRLREPGTAFLATFLLAAAGFHFLLFFFTSASAWAENLTSLNRLLLHVAPVWVLLLATLLATRRRLPGRYG